MLILTYVIILRIIIYILECVFANFYNNARYQTSLMQARNYHIRLKSQFISMESEKIDTELKLVQDQLVDINNTIRSSSNDNNPETLDASTPNREDHDVDSVFDGGHRQDLSRALSLSNISVPDDEKEIEARSELNNLESADMRLLSAQDELTKLVSNDNDLDLNIPDLCAQSSQDGTTTTIETGDEAAHHQQLVKELKDKIDQLERENDNYRSQIRAREVELNLKKIEPNLDRDLIKFLEQHRQELSLEFMKKAHKMLLEMKALDPEMDFNEYLEEKKVLRNDYMSDISQLLVNRREVEMRSERMKARHEEELSTFAETQLEHLFKIIGAQDKLATMRKKNEITNELIENLRKELVAKRNELEVIREKYLGIEIERTKYFEAWKTMQLKKEQLEEERKSLIRATIDSEASSLLINGMPPPPPPVELPSLNELLR